MDAPRTRHHDDHDLPLQRRKKRKRFPHGNYTGYYNTRYGLAPGSLETGAVSISQDDTRDPRMQLLQRSWFEGKKCLDVGCNEGDLTLALVKKFRPRRMVGVDIDEFLVQRARDALMAEVNAVVDIAKKRRSESASNPGESNEPNDPMDGDRSTMKIVGSLAIGRGEGAKRDGAVAANVSRPLMPRSMRRSSIAVTAVGDQASPLPRDTELSAPKKTNSAVRRNGAKICSVSSHKAQKGVPAADIDIDIGIDNNSGATTRANVSSADIVIDINKNNNDDVTVRAEGLPTTGTDIDPSNTNHTDSQPISSTRAEGEKKKKKKKTEKKQRQQQKEEEEAMPPPPTLPSSTPTPKLTVTISRGYNFDGAAQRASTSENGVDKTETETGAREDVVIMEKNSQFLSGCSVSFWRENFVDEPHADLPGGYDVVCLFSIVKWMHLNGGDGAVLSVFRKAHGLLRPGGRLILEPQPWKSYKKSARQHGSAEARANAGKIQLRPKDFPALLTGKVGFRSWKEVGVPKEGVGGFASRSVHVFTK